MDSLLSKEAYIQRIQEKFFKIGPYTYLNIELKGGLCVPCETLHLRWVFYFQDLGSTHVIARDFTLTSLDPTIGCVSVGGKECLDMEHAENIMFSGFFKDYVRELYEFEGIR
jgi:hypothetical protein